MQGYADVLSSFAQAGPRAQEQGGPERGRIRVSLDATSSPEVRHLFLRGQSTWIRPGRQALTHGPLTVSWDSCPKETSTCVSTS